MFILCNSKFCKNQEVGKCKHGCIELEEQIMGGFKCKNFIYDKTKSKFCTECNSHEFLNKTSYYDIESWCKKFKKKVNNHIDSGNNCWESR